MRCAFFVAGGRLAHAAAVLTAVLSDERYAEQWQLNQLQFLRGHRYFTKAANDLRSAGKQKNIARLEELLLNAHIAIS